MAFLTNLFTSVHSSLPSYLLQQSHSADYEYGVRGGRAKPCRACSDFQTWMQQSSKSKDGSKADDAPAKPPHQNPTTASSHKREDCPLDKDQLGRASWSLVHTMAAYYPETPTAEDRSSMGAFVRALGRFYPCESCAEDFRRDIDQHPPDTSSRTALAAWWCQAHNRVNRKLGKTEFAEPYFLHPEADFAEAQQWADGLLLPSEIGKAREELIVGGVTLPGSSTDCPDVLIEPLRKIFGEGGTAPEEEESLEELYRRLSCKSLPYHQAKAKLLLLYHFARLPLPEAAPWLATEQAEAVMTAHRHVLAAVDIFLHARLLRFALAAMELATALVQAVLPLTGGEDVVLFRKGAKLTDKELQRRKASDLEKKYGLSTPPPSSPSSSSPPAEPIIVGRLDGATIRQISSHMTDGFVGRCFNQHIRGIRRDHLRLMRLLITFKKDEAEKEEREWMMMAAKAGRPRPPPSLLAAIARELSEDLDRFIHGTPEPKLYISQLPEPPEPKSAAGAAAAATAASSSASPEKKKKKEDKKSNQMTVKLVVELKCFPRDHPEVKQSVGDVARQQAAINANIEREIQRQGLLQQYISYEEGTEKDQGKKGKKAGEEAAKYLSVLVRDNTNGGQVKVAKARMLTPAVVEELITRYCDEEGLVYGGPDPEEEEEEDGNGDGNGDGDEEEEESVEEEDDGGVETMDSGNGSGGGGSGTAILSYGKALGFPPERLMLPMFPKPVTEKWWLMLSTPYSGRISTVAFLVGQSGRLLLTVNVPRPVVVHAGDPNYPKVVGRVTASRKPTAYEPPSPLTEVLLLLKNSAYIGRDRLYRLHFFITRKAVRYVGAIEHHLGPR